MGATITTGKLSAALKRADGSIIYFLFEKTHESNVFPQHPHWSCIAIGDFKEVMRRVFLHASSCEGGSLQGVSRRYIKPENYIAAWRRQIAETVQIDDRHIQLSIGNTYQYHIDMNSSHLVFKALKRIGRDDFVEAIKAGNAALSLYQDIDIVLALYGVGGVFAPWRIVDHDMAFSNPQPEYAPPLCAEKINMVDAQVYRVDSNSVLHRHDDSEPWKFDWDFRVVGSFITKHAYDNEMLQTGSSKRLIADYRNLCVNAPPLPAATKITVTRITESDKTYDRNCVDQLAQELGLVEEGQLAPSVFQFVYGDVKTPVAMYRLTSLSAEKVVLEIPEQEVHTPLYAQPDLFAEAA